MIYQMVIYIMTKINQGRRKAAEAESAILRRVMKKCLTKKVLFEQRKEAVGKASHVFV